MKKRTGLWIGEIVLAFLLALMVPITAPACTATEEVVAGTYNGAWAPTNDEVLAFAMSSDDVAIQIYDFGSPETSMVLDSELMFLSIQFEEVTFEDVTSWTVTDSSGNQLILGETADFGIAFSSDDETWFDYTMYGTDSTYLLIDENTDSSILIHGADPVSTPIPAAALLFGSGLFGLAAARIRFRQD